MKCQHINFRFIFFSAFEGFQQIIFKTRYLRQASKVALLRQLNGGKLGFYSYDFFRPPPEGVVIGWDSLTLRYVWSHDEPVSAVAEIFTDQSKFEFFFFLNRVNNVNFVLFLIGKQYCCFVFVFQICKQYCYDKTITAVIGLVESRHIIDETFRT